MKVFKKAIYNFLTMFLTAVLLSAAVLFAALSSGCSDENKHGVGDKWEVKIKEDVTYSFEILDIQDWYYSVKVTNLNPEIKDYWTVITSNFFTVEIAAGGALLERGLSPILGDDSINHPEYNINFYLPFVEDSVNVIVKYGSFEDKRLVVDGLDVETGCLLEMEDKNVYTIFFRVYYE